MINFGLFSNGLRLDGVDQSFDLDLREVVTADRAGFHEAWFSEHTGVSGSMDGSHSVALPAVELLICKAAALTERIRMGPAVRRIALYPPQLVAI